MIPTKAQRDEWRKQTFADGVMTCTISEYVPSEFPTLLDATDELESRIIGLERTLNEVEDARDQIIALAIRVELRHSKNTIGQLEERIKHYEEVNYRDQELKVARKEAENARKDQHRAWQQKEEAETKATVEINRLRNIIISQSEQIATELRRLR